MILMKRTVILGIVFISILSILAVQQETQAQIILGHITGIVTDTVTGLPIDNATVTATLDSTIKSVASTN